MFQGFDDATVDFLWGIRFNNEKPWFESHKDDYLTHLYHPMRELAAECYDHVSGKLPDGGLMVKVSRIYRDARRLHGQGPYKDHLWFSIQTPADAWTAVPCFWFELGPEAWACGMGCYAVKPMTMAKLRARMEANPAPMEKLTRRLNRQSDFSPDGTPYKRPKGAAPSKLLEPWFSCRNYSLSHEEKLTEGLFSREIVERLNGYYDFLLPYYQYFSTLDGDPEPEA